MSVRKRMWLVRPPGRRAASAATVRVVCRPGTRLQRCPAVPVGSGDRQSSRRSPRPPSRLVGCPRRRDRLARSPAHALPRGGGCPPEFRPFERPHGPARDRDPGDQRAGVWARSRSDRHPSAIDINAIAIRVEFIRCLNTRLSSLGIRRCVRPGRALSSRGTALRIRRMKGSSEVSRLPITVLAGPQSGWLSSRTPEHRHAAHRPHRSSTHASHRVFLEVSHAPTRSPKPSFTRTQPQSQCPDRHPRSRSGQEEDAAGEDNGAAVSVEAKAVASPGS